MSRNRILSRLFIRGNLVLQSPLIIGNGESENTDVDLLKDHTGKPYIPGTSLAGVMRSFLANHHDFHDESEELQYLFGRALDVSHAVETTTSQMYISDATLLTDKFTISVRDGVQLNEYKSAVDGSKYDYEVLEPGCMFDLKMEVLLRERDEYYMRRNGKQQLVSNPVNHQQVKYLIAVLLQALENGELSFGAKTSRGFGRVQLQEVNVFEVDQDNYQALLDFDYDQMTTNVSVSDWIIDHWEKSYCEIKADLDLKGSLCIRSDRLDVHEADFAMLRLDDGRAVIPGTTWAGVFRHHITHLLDELSLSRQIVDELFGYISKTNDQDSAYSKIQFDESTFHQSNYRLIRRTTIDRFTGGTLKHALFTGEYLIGGETTLTIRLEKDYEKYLALLLFVLEDLNQGIVSVGGETSVGRGLFNVKRITIDGKPLTDHEKNLYNEQLYSTLYGGGVVNA